MFHISKYERTYCGIINMTSFPLVLVFLKFGLQHESLGISLEVW